MPLYDPGGHAAPLDYHRRLLTDPHRLDAYERAIRRLVRPGDVVLDLGAGTGILAMLCARAGAARVHAVESMPVAELAAEIVRANGLAEQVIVHRADATQLDPIEPVDLVVSDFLGCFLVDDGMLPAVAAAARWLKPGGRFCPASVRLLVAPLADIRLAAVEGFGDPVYGLDFAAARRQAMQNGYRIDCLPEWLLAEPAVFADYRPPDGEPPSGPELSFALARAGKLGGVAGWFEATLAPGVTLSTAPGVETHWAQHVFPLPATEVAAGDVLAVRLAVGDKEWRLEGELCRGGDVTARFLWTTEERPAEPPVAQPPRPADARAAIETLNWRGAAAYAADRFAEAVTAWEEATRLLGPAEDDMAGPVYENLGLALLARGRADAAVRALLRSLDGAPTSRRQAAEFLVRAAFAAGRRSDGERWRALYEAAFGPLDL